MVGFVFNWQGALDAIYSSSIVREIPMNTARDRPGQPGIIAYWNMESLVHQVPFAKHIKCIIMTNIVSYVNLYFRVASFYFFFLFYTFHTLKNFNFSKYTPFRFKILQTANKVKLNSLCNNFENQLKFCICFCTDILLFPHFMRPVGQIKTKSIIGL